ncbi:hypothetical protein [Senegalia massiliensis]
MKKSNSLSIIEKLIEDNIVIGCSAGSIVMQKNGLNC